MTTGPAKILIAEDNVANRELLREMLEPHGYDIEEAEDGQDALAKAKSFLPDLVLMDVDMPRLDGVAAVQRLRAEPGLAGIPVIALTAYAMHGDRERFLALGFDSYMSKPVRSRVVSETVEELLQKRGFHGAA